MKRCPKCKREYGDDLRFCLEDGAPLSGNEVMPTIAAPTMVLPGEQNSATTMSKVGRPDVPLPGSSGPAGPALNATQTTTVKSPGLILVSRIVVGLLVVLVVLSNLIGFATYGWLITRRLPIILGFIAVMLFAIIRAARHPRVSLLAGAALGFDLLESFVYIMVSRFAPDSFQTAMIILDSFAAAAVIITLTLAVLSERQTQSAT
jgi:hypothetical protein